MATLTPKRPKIYVMVALAARSAAAAWAGAYLGIVGPHPHYTGAVWPTLAQVPPWIGGMAFLGALPMAYVRHSAPLLIGGWIGLSTASYAGWYAGGCAFITTAVAQRGSLGVLRRLEATTTVESRGVPGPIRHLAGLAALVAGPRWAGGLPEWMADLQSRTQDGRQLTWQAQLRFALGLLVAAIRMRLGDLARWADRRLDWVLATRERVFAATAVVVGVSTLALVVEGGGVTAAVTHARELGEVGVGVWSAGLLLRRIRGLPADRSRPTQAKPPSTPPPTSAAAQAQPRRRPDPRRQRGRRRRHGTSRKH